MLSIEHEPGRENERQPVGIRQILRSRPARHIQIFLSIAAAGCIGAKLPAQNDWLWKLHLLWVTTVMWTVANYRARHFSAVSRIFYYGAWSAACAGIWYGVSCLYPVHAETYQLSKLAIKTHRYLFVIFLIPSIITLICERSAGPSTFTQLKLSKKDRENIESGSSEHVSRWEQTRNDVRNHATLLIQVVALSITTATLAIGWFATSYYTDQRQLTNNLSGYSIAVTRLQAAGVNPKTQQADLAISDAQHEKLDEARHRADRMFIDRVMDSAGTAVLMCFFSLIISIMICAACALGYMVSTARRRSHELAALLEASVWVPLNPSDRPTDHFLTARSMMSFGFFLWLVSAVLTVVAGETVVRYIAAGYGGYSSVLGFFGTVTAVKFWFASFTLGRYLKWEYDFFKRDIKL